MIQRKLNILSQAGLAKEDFSGATNTVIGVSYDSILCKANYTTYRIAGKFGGEKVW